MRLYQGRRTRYGAQLKSRQAPASNPFDATSQDCRPLGKSSLGREVGISDLCRMTAQSTGSRADPACSRVLGNNGGQIVFLNPPELPDSPATSQRRIQPHPESTQIRRCLHRVADSAPAWLGRTAPIADRLRTESLRYSGGVYSSPAHIGGLRVMRQRATALLIFRVARDPDIAPLTGSRTPGPLSVEGSPRRGVHVTADNDKAAERAYSPAVAIT